MVLCIFDAMYEPLLDQLRATLDRDEPGWTVEDMWCRLHQEYHELKPAPGQRAMLATPERAAMKPARPTQRFVVLEGGVRCFHANTSPALAGPCAYCGVMLHTHADALGAVKSGRAGAGYLEERCPACHRANAVYPAYGLGGIRVMPLAEEGPVMQMKLVRFGGRHNG